MSMKEKILLINRDKKNHLIICLMTLCSIIALFAFSYITSIKNFWREWTENSYDFRLYYISNNGEQNQESIIKKLKENANVEDVFSYLEFMSYGTILEFKNDQTDGQINIIGTIPNTKKIKTGRDLGTQDFEIICPSNIFPNTMLSTSEYNPKGEINLDSIINSTIEINIFSDSSNKENFKLVGTYDEKFDYSDTNICYTNHNTIKKINAKYQPDIQGSEDVYFLLKKDGNLSEVKKIAGISEITKVKELKKDIGDEVIGISFLSIGLMFGTMYIFIYLISLNKLKNNYFKYGIMSALGFSMENLRNLVHTEILYMLIISQTISLLITKIITLLYSKIFFANDMQLSKLTINPPLKIIIFNIVLSAILIFIANIKNINSLKKLNVKEILEQ